MPKILLEAIKLQKSFGAQRVLDVDKLTIYDGERIALIGENGAGKSTLFSILAGETEPDSGQVRRFCPLSLIHQSGQTRTDGSARYAAEMRAPAQRDGLSGGELTRRRIAAALSENTPLLFADEPTTDLDAGGIARLTQLLTAYRGTLVLISHDRALLNSLCTRVLHLEDGKITDFPGNYEDYRRELSRRREHQQFEYDRYRAEQARLKALMQQKTEWAASVRKAPKRMGNSEARLHTHEYTNAVLKQSAAKKTVQDRLNRLEKKERPRDLPSIRMALGVTHPVEAKTALSVRCDKLTAGDRLLIKNAQFVLPTGSKTALLGENGSGKTTLLRTLRGEALPGIAFHGTVRFNPAVQMAVFDQDHAKTLALDGSALYNVLSDSSFPESEARTVLARLGIAGDNVFKAVGVLSGGERAKIALAKLLLSDANLLLLDEPTNHLDLFTMESLEKLLKEYGGTLLFVSHDTSFVSAVAERILTIENETLVTFEGTLAQKKAAATNDLRADISQTELSTLEMRLAALAARLSAPKKGDKPDQLSAEYDALAATLRELKQRMK